jgi:hypothetical protein
MTDIKSLVHINVDSSAIPPYNAMDRFIVTDRPTQKDIDLAHEQLKVVFSFIKKPETVVDYATSQAFQEGWLVGLGLKPSHRLCLVLVPNNFEDCTVKEYQDQYLTTIADQCKDFEKHYIFCMKDDTK